MVSEHIRKRVESVNTKEEYDELLNGFKMSDAPIKVRDEAIRYLKAKKSEFDDDENMASKEVLKMIKEGEADISDMGTGY